MPSNRGLFDRLRTPDLGTARSVHERTDQVQESILRHLQRILNTRHGDSAAVPEFGIPALTDMDLAGRADEMRRTIEDSIRTFEPRLSSVRVRWQEVDESDVLKLRFEILARLTTSDEKVGVRFATVVDANGQWKVAG
ncbi:MAG TPA: type VI secretion system baseplate subunit TssE [Myxococcota bacterium]|jgi:type VI secretion system lysozyme-like protein|nr:type VI secretion system baseplate subunit TssE [Myxococcota bacterium]